MLDTGLDAATIAELRDESEDLLMALIDLLAIEAPARIAALTASVAAGERVGAERAAHTLKSSAATVGALVMRDRAAAAESAARAGELATVAAMIEPLREASERACAALRLEIKKACP
jgi:HPt (histidine-containing phosphotransfer) domain-containing protein